MKFLIPLTTLLLSAPAFAAIPGSIAPCYKDRATAARIDRVPAAERLGVRNPKGEEVGAFVFEGKRGTRVSELYLCGNNANSFYVDADVKDWVGPARQKLEIGRIWNDEYAVKSVAQTWSNNRLRADIVMTVWIDFTGARGDADYTQAAGDLMLTLPLDR